MKRSLFLVLVLIFVSNVLHAQISAPTADATDVTNYPVFPETDDIFIFCTVDSMVEEGMLSITTQLEGTKTFLWEKYNELSGTFELYFQESLDGSTSQIQNLGDGCYRSTVTLGANSEVDRAWIFNNWTVVNGFVSDSNCESFLLNGKFKSAVLTYYDLSTNAELDVYKDVQLEWQLDGTKISSVQNLTFYDPPTKDTEYTLVVSDKFGCEGTMPVLYESIVTKAIFSADPMSGEGPLTVTFNNASENGSPGYYEWLFYRDIDEITEEAENSPEPVDSILFVAYDEAPVYTYENSGSYWVKLISRHVSENHTCVDTIALEKYIIVDTSFVLVPNVFTPNGDGVNDNFVIKFWSMKSLEMSIYNRWGKRVHYWESGDVQGFEGTWSETVWDGRIGGRYASPGVYYYDVLGYGRDDKNRKAHGFLHLFRDKN